MAHRLIRQLEFFEGPLPLTYPTWWERDGRG